MIGLGVPFLESLRITLQYKQTFLIEIWRGSQNDCPSLFNRWFFCGLTFLTIPVAHFSGYGYQLLLIIAATILSKGK